MKRWVIGIVFVSLLALFVSFLLLPAFHPSKPQQTFQPDIEALLKDLPINQIEQRQLFSFGDELYRKGRYKQAREYYEKVLSALETKRKEFLESDRKALRRAGEEQKDREQLRKHLGELSAWARWRIAYTYARQRKWDEAIREFRELLRNYDGTWSFRTTQPYSLPERALYQIACCYRGRMREAKGEGEKEYWRQKAINAFTEVMVQFPDSPISVLAARAIADLNGGKLPDRAGKVYYRVLKRDEERRRRQQLLWSMCGPAALHWLLKAHFPKESFPSIEQISKMAKTDETGTSLFNLKEAAKKLGVRTSAFEVTFDGLKEIKLPALLLFGGHYVVVTKVKREGIWVVNPIPPLVLGSRKGQEIKEVWQFVETFLPREKLGDDWKAAVLVVLGKY